MSPTEEELIAYADGELNDDRAAEVRTAVEADPALAARVETHRRLRARVAAAYAPVAAEPVPDRLAALLAEGLPAAEVVDLAARRRASKPAAAPPARFGSPRIWALAAAGVAAVALIAPWLGSFGTGGGDLLTIRGGAVVPAASLARALDRAPGGETAGPVRIGFSFRTADGVYCRTFAAGGRRATSGLACREADGWRVRALADGPPASSAGTLRTASAELSPAVLAAADALIEGEALDRSAETAALARRWRPEPRTGR